MTANIAVFASGNGSNLQVFLDAAKDPNWPAPVRLVVSDKPDCYAVERARTAGVPVLAALPKAYLDKADFETKVLEQLTAHGVELIVLAGYMRLIGPTLLRAYPQRIINIHPSLLPAFPGKQAVKDALEAGVETTGVTVHYVDEGVDTGSIIAQTVVRVEPGDSEESLLARLHAAEHQLYPSVVRKLAMATQ